MEDFLEFSELVIPPIEREDVSEQPEITDVWEKEEDMTEAVNQFEQVEAKSAKLGIQFFNPPKKLCLIDDIDPNATPRLVTRSEQRKVVEFAYEKSREIRGGGIASNRNARE
jgi:hypothetical protein